MCTGREIPTADQIRELLAFLPELEALSDDEVVDLGTRLEGDPPHAPDAVRYWYCDYHPVVDRFFETMYQDCWMDPGYDPARASDLAEAWLNGQEEVNRATWDELKLVMTWMARWERFCMGHQGQMVTSGLAVLVLKQVGRMA